MAPPPQGADEHSPDIANENRASENQASWHFNKNSENTPAALPQQCNMT